MKKEEYLTLLDNEYDFPDKQENVHFRYGVIGINDLKRDLKYWETLLVSSMM